MITWRARAHQQCDSVLLLTCRTKRGNPTLENCVTTVFSAYVTTSGQAWADFDVFMPGRWDKDLARRRAAGIPRGVERKTKPLLAIDQLERLLKAGLPARWAAFGEVYGRSSALRGACEAAGLPYVAVIPRDFRITLPSGAVIKAEDAVRDAVFERRSCGNGSKGPRYADWALTATASPRHFLLIRRLISRPDRPGFLPVLGSGRPACDDDVLRHHRREALALRTDVQDRKGHTRLGPVPGAHLGRALPAHRPGRARPAPPRRHPQRAVRRHHPPAPAPPGAEAGSAGEREEEASRRRSAALTWASPSATRPSPPSPGSPARPASAPSSSPSPRPPA